MITPKNLVQHELISLHVKILKSSNPQVVGLQGEVIDETRNMLILETKTGMKKIVKEECEFLFKLPSGEKVKVLGKIIVARPEDRIKKKFKKW